MSYDLFHLNFLPTLKTSIPKPERKHLIQKGKRLIAKGKIHNLLYTTQFIE